MKTTAEYKYHPDFAKKQLDWQAQNRILKINIESSQITILNDKYELTSASTNDLEFYKSLFMDKEIMTTYYTGRSEDEERVMNRCRSYESRVRNANPYTGFVVRKIGEKEPIAYIAISCIHLTKQQMGVLEIALICKPEYQNRGLGTDIVELMLFGYVPHCIDRGYPVKYKDIITEVNLVVGVCQETNEAMNKILQNLGFEYKYQEHRDYKGGVIDVPLNHYELEIGGKLIAE